MTSQVPSALGAPVGDLPDRMLMTALGAWMPEAVRGLSFREGALRPLPRLPMLSLCAWCQRCRNASEQWVACPAWLQRMAGTRVTHGCCPECKDRVLAEFLEGLQREDLGPVG